MFQFLKTSVNAIHRSVKKGEPIADVNISVSLDTCNDLQDSEAEFSLTVGEAEELVARLSHTIVVAKRAQESFRAQESVTLNVSYHEGPTDLEVMNTMPIPSGEGETEAESESEAWEE